MTKPSRHLPVLPQPRCHSGRFQRRVAPLLCRSHVPSALIRLRAAARNGSAHIVAGCHRSGATELSARPTRAGTLRAAAGSALRAALRAAGGAPRALAARARRR
jgi:hypothetical protein